MKKKSLIAFLAAFLFLWCFSFSASAEEPGGSGLEEYFKVSDHTPYVSGYGNHMFGPNKSITRAETAQMLYNLLLTRPTATETKFSDVPLSRWYGQAVNALAQIGVFHGYGDGTFHPNAPITRAELVKAITACVPSEGGNNPFSDVSSGHWAYQAILTAASKKWINGYPNGTFRPGKSISRAETVAILNRALGRTGKGFAENRTGEYFNDIQESNWAYLDIVEASGATAYQPSGQGPSGSQLQVDVSGLNLRSGPGTNYSIVTVLGEKSILTLLDRDNDPWLHVKTQDNREGYVHSDYVSEYTANTAPADKITLSSSSVTLPQYKSLRLDGLAVPRTTLVWKSSNESVATVSTIRYSEGDESCIVYGKAPGTATISCSDYTGGVREECAVTVQAAEPVRFAFTEPNFITTATSAKLIAITDTQKSAVRFTVKDSLGNSILNREISASTSEACEDNATKVFQCPMSPMKAGKYSVEISSRDSSGKYSTADGFTFTVHASGVSGATTDQERDLSDTMIDLIMEYEAYIPTIRDDKLAPGNPTVGYGHVVGVNRTFYNNMTKREAKAFLVDSIRSNYGAAVNAFRERHHLKMSQNQYDALVSFVYNLGPSYMNNPSGNYLFTGILNAVVPPGGISESNPCSAVLNVKDVPLYEAPVRNSEVKQSVKKGKALQVTDVRRNEETKELWYKVNVGSDTGWMRAGHIKLNAPSAVHDLNYVDSMTVSTYMLSYHHANSVCIPGLLYRRLREAKIFFYGDYAQASSGSSFYKMNTYHFIYPDCMKEYE